MAGAASADSSSTIVYLWPCNVPAWEAWKSVQTQWRTGAAGATGLDYAGVRAYLDEQGLAGGSEQRRDIFTGICAAERATLEAWAEQAEQNKPG